MNSPKNILLVLNPVSGNMDKDFLLNKLNQQLPVRTTMEILKTTGKNDEEKIRKAIEKQKPDRILVAGGDGSVKLVAESLQEKNTPIGILPVGSANGLASDLDLPTAPEAYIEVALSEKTREIDAIRINGQLCIHISDFGLNAELIKNYEKSGFRGKFGYAMNSLPTLYNSEMPYHFLIETKGETKKHEAIMLAIANSRKYGTGAVVNPNGKMDDGAFEVLIFKKFDILEIIKTLQGDVEISPGFVETIRTTRATITTPFPIDFQIDGEYCSSLQKTTAEILPKKLRVFTP